MVGLVGEDILWECDRRIGTAARTLHRELPRARCERALEHADPESAPCRARYIPKYFGPPPASGTTHSMMPYGSAMSHVLQCTQFEKLMIGPSPFAGV